MAGPANFDDAYQVFLNGALLGSFGRFNSKRPAFYYVEPMIFPLPKQGTEEDATRVIAFRMWMSPTTLPGRTDAGGFHLAPQVGTTDAVAAEYQLRWLDLMRENALWAVTGLVSSLLALIAFALFLFNRSDRVYFWMGSLLLMLGWAVGNRTGLLDADHHRSAELWVCYVLVIPLVNLSWFMMLLRAWFGLDRPRWPPWAVALLSVAQGFVFAGRTQSAVSSRSLYVGSSVLCQYAGAERDLWPADVLDHVSGYS